MAANALYLAKECDTSLLLRALPPHELVCLRRLAAVSVTTLFGFDSWRTLPDASEIGRADLAADDALSVGTCRRLLSPAVGIDGARWLASVTGSGSGLTCSETTDTPVICIPCVMIGCNLLLDLIVKPVWDDARDVERAVHCVSWCSI